jgi:hypothetical protein
VDERRLRMRRSRRNTSVLIVTRLIRSTDEWWMSCLFSAVGWTRFSALGVSLAVLLPFPLCTLCSIHFLRCRHLLHASCLSPTFWVTSPSHGTTTLGHVILFLSAANSRSKAARQGGRWIWGFVDQSRYWPFLYHVFSYANPCYKMLIPLDHSCMQ